jgi:hypothetical protein
MQALPSSQVDPFGRGEQIPTVPDRLQALHALVQALSQHTPPTQKPEAHPAFDVQVRAKEGS